MKLGTLFFRVVAGFFMLLALCLAYFSHKPRQFWQKIPSNEVISDQKGKSDQKGRSDQSEKETLKKSALKEKSKMHSECRVIRVGYQPILQACANH